MSCELDFDVDYVPDGFRLFILNNNSTESLFLFGSWRGGYLNGDSWRRNSGTKKLVVREVDDETFYYFLGYSGSVYAVIAEREGMLGFHNQSVYDYHTNHVGINHITLSELIERLDKAGCIVKQHCGYKEYDVEEGLNV